MLAGAGFLQYEVSAYSKPHFRCRHNLNYWSFGDYLGIGAGAHGKVSYPDGRVLRYAKTRQPEAYMAAQASSFTASQNLLSPADVSGEFMLNALRLNDGFSREQFRARTGQDATVLDAAVRRFQRQGLLDEGQQIKASELGRRFLDTLVAGFFPDS